MSARAKIFAHPLLRNPLVECLTAWALVMATLVALAMFDTLPWLASNSGAVAGLVMLLAPHLTLPRELEPRDYLLPPIQWRLSLSATSITCLAILVLWGPAQHLWRTLLSSQVLQLHPLTLHSMGWIPTFILVQTFAIALPEEAFFRGYLQTRLSTESWNRPILRLGSLQITTVNLLVSVLFALVHLPASPSPHRLATFFPSLLFGALRDRTGSVAAPILVHAACNLFMEITVRAYA